MDGPETRRSLARLIHRRGPGPVRHVRRGTRSTDPAGSSRPGAARGRRRPPTSSRAPRSVRSSARSSRGARPFVGRARATRPVPRGRSRRGSRPARVRRRARRARLPAPRCGTCSSSGRPRCATRSAAGCGSSRPTRPSGPFVAGPGGDDAVCRCRGAVRSSPSLDDLPGVELEGVVLANELLDNLPFGIAVFTADGWAEVRVALAARRVRRDRRARAARPTSTALARVTAGLDAAVGDRLPIPRGVDDGSGASGDAAARVRRAGRHDGHRRRPARARVRQWLRTYRGARGRRRSARRSRARATSSSDVVVEQLHHAAADAGFDVVSDRTQAGVARRARDRRRGRRGAPAVVRAGRGRRPRRARGAQPRDPGRRAHRPDRPRRPPGRRAGKGNGPATREVARHKDGRVAVRPARADPIPRAGGRRSRARPAEVDRLDLVRRTEGHA